MRAIVANVSKLLTCCLFRFVLNESPTRPSPSSSQGGSVDGAAAAASGQSLPQAPPGMNIYAAKRVIGEAQWTAEQLEQVQSSKVVAAPGILPVLCARLHCAFGFNSVN